METLSVARPQASPTILDLCTGSGCIAVAVAKQLPAARLTAVDISPAALAVARENAAKHKVAERVEFVEGNLFSPLPAERRFDVIATNPPYVLSSEMATLDDTVLKYEPRLALDGGADGLALIRPIIAEAPNRLQPGGLLFLELSPDRADAAIQLAEATGLFQHIGMVKDLAGKPRVLKAQRR
jgi:release factor glutamine methyltransferase